MDQPDSEKPVLLPGKLGNPKMQIEDFKGLLSDMSSDNAEASLFKQ